MSVLLRKPRIDEIADGLDSDTLKAFLEALNSNEGYEHYSLRGGNLPQGTAPSVTKCTLSIDGPAELSGVFVRYTNGVAKAAMVAFTDLDSCITYDIDEAKLTCRKVRERLSASELRRVISERLGGGGGGGGGAGIKTLEINLQDYMSASDYSALVTGILRNSEDFSGNYELTKDIDSTEYDRIRVNIPVLLDDETIPFVLVCNKVAQGATPMFMSNFDWGESNKPVVFFSIYGSEDSIGYVSCIAKIQESSSTIIRRY